MTVVNYQLLINYTRFIFFAVVSGDYQYVDNALVFDTSPPGSYTDTRRWILYNKSGEVGNQVVIATGNPEAPTTEVFFEFNQSGIYVSYQVCLIFIVFKLVFMSEFGSLEKGLSGKVCSVIIFVMSGHIL